MEENHRFRDQKGLIKLCHEYEPAKREFSVIFPNLPDKNLRKVNLIVSKRFHSRGPRLIKIISIFNIIDFQNSLSKSNGYVHGPCYKQTMERQHRT